MGTCWCIAGSGIGSGIGNLAPEALEKAKSVVGNLKGDSGVDSDSEKKGFLSKIPFLGKEK